MLGADPEPVQRPVAFMAADVAAADELIDRFGALAAAVVPQPRHDERRLARMLTLTRAANASLASGEAREGLKVREFARGANYESDKHIREGLAGNWPRRWSACAIRLLMAASTPVLAEHLSSSASPVRRESRFIGFDNHRGASKVKPLLNLHLAAIDRHLLGWQIPLAAGTTWDRTHHDADEDAIAAAEADLGEPLPGSLADHLALALSERAELREAVSSARVSHAGIFLEAGLDPETVMARAFSDLLVIAPLPHGASLVKHESHSRLVLPGDDPALVELARSSGVGGIAACNTPRDGSLTRTPSHEIRLPTLLSSQWGLTASPWHLTFHAIGDDLLLRRASDGNGVTIDLWRVFGISNADPVAAALAQRVAEQWTLACSRRAETDAPPGSIYAQRPDFRMALRAFIRFADAARVTAERQRRSR